LSSARLLDKTALVTGASRGIGRAVAERFAREGATVALNHFRDHAEAETALAAVHAASDAAGHGRRNHLIVEADIGSPEAVAAMIDEVVAAWSRLDILVNNAGIQAPTPGESWDAETLNRIIGVNLIGAAYAAQQAIRHFLSRPGGGVIINTSSVHEIIPKPGFLAYSISKGGMGNLTRTLALEFAGHGVRVNAVGPGAVLTSLNDAWRNDAVSRAAVERHIPMGRAAEPEEIASVFAFLASEDAAYITGQTIYACGGLTLYGDFKENWAS